MCIQDWSARQELGRLACGVDVSINGKGGIMHEVYSTHEGMRCMNVSTGQGLEPFLSMWSKLFQTSGVELWNALLN